MRLNFADLGSARPRLPRVITKMSDFSLSHLNELAPITDHSCGNQQLCLLPDRHTSGVGVPPTTPSARSERLQHRARILPRGRPAQEHLAGHLGAQFKDANTGELHATPADGQLLLLMRARIPAPA